MPHFTYEQVKKSAMEVVALVGNDYTYPSRLKKRDPAHPEYSPACQYVDTDDAGELLQASCAVGRILARLGVPLELLHQFEFKAASDVINGLYEHGYTFEKVDLVNQFLNKFQLHQDGGDPWVRALARAIQSAESANI